MSMSLEQNTRTLWNTISSHMKTRTRVDIQSHPTCRTRFQEIVESTYAQINTYDTITTMNTQIIDTLITEFTTICSNSATQPTSLQNNVRQHVLHCSIDEHTRAITRYHNYRHVRSACCKTMELYDCVVWTHTNELGIQCKRWLREYLVLFVDIFINNRQIAENVVFTQQQITDTKVLFVSDTTIPCNDVCTKIHFILKDHDLKPLSLQYNVTIQTMIAGHMLTLHESVPACLKEPTYFAFLIQTGSVRIGDILMLPNAELTVIASGTIDIQDQDTIIVTNVGDTTSHNAFFCKLDSKFKLASEPNRVVFKNKCKYPILCMEFSS